MIVAVVSDKDAFAVLSARVALRIVPWAFGWVRVEHALAEPDQGLPESPPSDTFPCGEPASASDQRIEEEGRVLHDPRHYRVIYGDLPVDPLFKT